MHSIEIASRGVVNNLAMLFLAFTESVIVWRSRATEFRRLL